MIDKNIIIIITATLLIAMMMYFYYSGLYAKIMDLFINPTAHTYRLTSPFGYRKHPVTGDNMSFHNGEDYATPMGTTLIAPASGTVTLVKRDGTGGLQVVIKHDNGFATGYAHLDSVQCSHGDKLLQGQIFAHTGNSGASTGPHLHFTLRNPAGQRIAPSTYFYQS